MRFYTAEARRGNLQILCHACNTIKADINPAEYRTALLWTRSSITQLLLRIGPARRSALIEFYARGIFRNIVSKLRAHRPK